MRDPLPAAAHRPARRLITVGTGFGADGIAALLVRELMQAGATPRLDWHHCDNPIRELPALLDTPAGDDAIIVDALLDATPDARVRWLRLKQLAPTAPITGSHGFGLADTLRLLASLGLTAPTRIVGIPVASADELPDAAHRDRLREQLRALLDA